MFRTPLRIQIRRLSTPAPRNNSRNLVSSVLLTRTWENDSVAELKQEAKKRGLPQRGNKAALISRIQEYDQRTAHSLASHDPPKPAQTREASTAVAPSTTPPSDTPVVALGKQYLDIKLPDLSAPPAELEVHIPFAPDFWESSRVKKESAPPAPTEPPTPKLVVVGGESTYPGGSPTLNLLPSEELALEAESNDSSAASASADRSGLWADIAEDAGLPTTLKLSPPGRAREALLEGLIEETTTSTGQGQTHGRTLDPDEVRGVWVLLGVLTGSWLLAGVFKGKSAFAEHPEEVQTEAEGSVKA